MKTPRRIPIEPNAKFGRMLLNARKSGNMVVADEITITPPSPSNKYWTLRVSFRDMSKERSAKDTLGEVNAAYLDLSSEL